MEGIEIVPHLRGYYRSLSERAELDGSGDGTVEFAAVRPGYLWLLDTVTVAGTSIGGARVTLYRDSIGQPDRIIGTVELAATDPAAIFQANGDTTWLRNGEQLLARITGAGASSEAIASVSYRLVELEERAWHSGPVAVNVVGLNVPAPPASEEVVDG